ncbi:hypothetical protein AB5I41_21355 [Sphingomonas sp. MMS24-JH45]
MAAADDAFGIDGRHDHGGAGRDRAAGARPSLARPAVVLNAALDCLDPAVREGVLARVRRWVADAIARATPSLAAMAAASEAKAAGPGLRSIAGAIEAGGVRGAHPARRRALRLTAPTAATGCGGRG